MSSVSPSTKRLMREAQELSTTPSPDYTASPLETDLFEWHFTFRGPPGSPYADGLYHGRIILPHLYPLRPPSFRFLTPSGRFETNREICLSISGHHEETWQPAWSVRTALVALRSFMETEPQGQLGGLVASDDVRRTLAKESRAWTCSGCGGRTNEDIIKESEEAAKVAEARAKEERGKRKVPPPELKLDFWHEMEKAAAAEEAAEAAEKAAAAEAEATAQAMEDAETAELAEGFVQTVPRADLDSAVSSRAASRARLGRTVLRPTRTVLRPTRTAPQPNAAQQAELPNAAQQAELPNAAQQAEPQQQQAFNDGVPNWLDSVILTLITCLMTMILKVLLGY